MNEDDPVIRMLSIVLSVADILDGSFRWIKINLLILL